MRDGAGPGYRDSSGGILVANSICGNSIESPVDAWQGGLRLLQVADKLLLLAVPESRRAHTIDGIR